MGINRVEIISKVNGREKVVRAEDIELQYQDDGKTLKIFYGYGIKCIGNNGNLDSCGCEGIKNK